MASIHLHVAYNLVSGILVMDFNIYKTNNRQKEPLRQNTIHVIHYQELNKIKY